MPAFALHSEPKDECEAEFRIALGRKAVDLLPQDIDRPFRQNPGGHGKVVANGRSTRKQPIERHKGGHGREHREQTVEHDARGDCEQSVLSDLFIGAPENILPSLPGYLPGRFGVTAPAWLMRPLVLRELRLVSTTGLPKAPVSRRRATLPRARYSRTVSLASIIPTRTAEHKSGQSGAKLRDSARNGVEAGILV